MAEQLSAQGVPVFLADIKGDLSGMAAPGSRTRRSTSAAAEHGARVGRRRATPSSSSSLGGMGKGVPIRAIGHRRSARSCSSKVLGLNATQESSLGLVFHYADQPACALDDLKDLRAVITYLTSDEGKADLKELGGLSSATAGVILRELITFCGPGRRAFFGQPEFDTAGLLRTAADGRGMVTCLELPAVQDRPALFSTFLMWLLADLYHDLPEVGDLEKPKLVFFFDEAHLLFDDASKEFLDADPADRAADPLEGRRHLLRDAVAQGRPGRRPGPARQPGPARSPRVHPGRRQGAQGRRLDLPHERLRPQQGADLARYRRGGHHRAVREGRPDTGRLDPDARARSR